MAKWIILAALCGLASSPAHAGGYCQDAQALSHTADSYRSLVAALMTHCQPGDSIVLDGFPQAVAIACDFNRPIVNTGRTVTCILAAEPRRIQ